uniref:Immunoglobulin domain-containing protein n=1 Tax=Esox lucius TaxID=8010 RepID=A0A3P9APH6_ESOLU
TTKNDLIQLCICFILGVLGDVGTEIKTVRGIEGRTITLNTGLTGLQNDSILWTYGTVKAETTIATLNVGRNRPEYNERLNLDAHSGSLTIKSLTTSDYGIYELRVIREQVWKQTFNLTIYGEFISGLERSGEFTESHDCFVQPCIMLAIDLIQLCICFILGVLGDVGTEIKTVRGIEGQTITLNTGLTGLQNDSIYWTYGPVRAQTRIATLNVGRNIPEYNERLNLDAQSGSLTIRSLTTSDNGIYELTVLREQVLKQTFKLTIYGEFISAL